MSGVGPDRTDTCYRHGDRQSYILCQRCGRTICPECQTQAAVGFHCPECVREARASAPRTKPRLLTRVKRAGSNGAPVVTYSIIGLTAFVFVLQFVTADLVTLLLTYYPALTERAPWTMMTSLLVHGGIFHIFFNMFSLFIFGRVLEPMIGRARFLALYVLSGLGGSVVVLLLDPNGGVLGASGAVFGLFGAFFIIQRGLGGNGSQLLVLIGINLAIGFLPGTNISWQAHLGGVIVGAIVGFIYLRTRAAKQRPLQIGLLGATLAALIAITVVSVGS